MAIRTTGDPNWREDKSRCLHHEHGWLSIANDLLQGFDEFMNLVIDDAVEVKLATKSEEESRRSLGELYMILRPAEE